MTALAGKPRNLLTMNWPFLNSHETQTAGTLNTNLKPLILSNNVKKKTKNQKTHTVYQKQKPTVAQSKVVCNYVLQNYWLLSSHLRGDITKSLLTWKHKHNKGIFVNYTILFMLKYSITENVVYNTQKLYIC